MACKIETGGDMLDVELIVCHVSICVEGSVGSFVRVRNKGPSTFSTVDLYFDVHVTNVHAGHTLHILKNFIVSVLSCHANVFVLVPVQHRLRF